jgi:adenine-specific DNA-methyltransferase
MVVYADPPYSRAQYSRYYHVLETLTRYDYPDSIGVGRYRPDRFQTIFSLASGVEEAMEDLASGVASLGACLVLSYPSNGLLYEIGGDVETCLSESFKSVRLVYSAATNHSTMGAGPGRAHTEVDEMIFVATRPRN